MSGFEFVSESSRHAVALEMATLHYTRGHTMEAIARQFGVSRSTVSRMLTWAREAGLVEIRIRPGELGDDEVADRIVERFGVEECRAVPAGSLSPGERFDVTAARGAGLLDTLLESDMVVGISWGTMINALSLGLRPRNVVNCQVVQLNGFGNSTSTGVHYSNRIFERFGEAFSAYVQQYPVPLFFDREEARDSLMHEYSIQRVRRLQHAADLVLFNVGTVEDYLPNSPYLAGYNVGTQEAEQIRRDEVVGEIAGTYFQSDGHTSGVEINKHTSGPDLERLKLARYKICVTSGEHKVEALKAALEGGYVSHLVIDTDTAAALLASE